jgi:hypothetical protein
LVAKRREITTGRLGHALEHVDATIRLFAGEPGNALVSALWMVRKPQSTDQLAALVRISPKQAGAVLRYLADCGLVRGERAAGQSTTWHPVY